AQRALNDRGRISVQFTIEELPAECQDVDAQDEFIVISSGAFESDDLRVAQYGQSPRRAFNAAAVHRQTEPGRMHVLSRSTARESPRFALLRRQRWTAATTVIVRTAFSFGVSALRPIIERRTAVSTNVSTRHTKCRRKIVRTPYLPPDGASKRRHSSRARTTEIRLTSAG